MYLFTYNHIQSHQLCDLYADVSTIVMNKKYRKPSFLAGRSKFMHENQFDACYKVKDRTFDAFAKVKMLQNH